MRPTRSIFGCQWRSNHRLSGCDQCRIRRCGACFGRRGVGDRVHGCRWEPVGWYLNKFDYSLHRCYYSTLRLPVPQYEPKPGTAAQHPSSPPSAPPNSSNRADASPTVCIPPLTVSPYSKTRALPPMQTPSTIYCLQLYTYPSRTRGQTLLHRL